jgi:hypothetical protein
MKKLFSILITMFLFSIHDGINAQGEGKAAMDTIKHNNASSEGNTLIKCVTGYDTLLKEENFTILGFKNLPAEKAIRYIETKFKPHVHFDDFRVDSLYNKQPAAIDFSSNPGAKRFRTVITSAYQEEGLTFAGHYCFIEWGCGSPCQSCVIVDLKTGKIYDGVSAALGYQYQRDSRLLIVNPTDSSGYYLDCGYCEPLVYVWNERDKRFEERN